MLVWVLVLVEEHRARARFYKFSVDLLRRSGRAEPSPTAKIPPQGLRQILRAHREAIGGIAFGGSALRQIPAIHR